MNTKKNLSKTHTTMKKLVVFLIIILFALGACGRSENVKANKEKKKKDKITQVKKMKTEDEQKTEAIDTAYESSDDEYSYPDSLY